MTFKIKSFGNQEEPEVPKAAYKIKEFDKEVPSIGEQLKNSPAFFGREVAAQVKGLPRTFADTLRHGSKKLQELGESQALAQEREVPEGGDPITNKIVNILGKPSEFLEKIGFPTTDEARKALTDVISERYGQNIPQEGRGRIEKFAQGSGGAIPFAAGAGPLGALGIVGAGGISKAADLDPGSELATNIAIPTALELIKLISTKKYIPKPGEAADLFKVGKNLGLSDKQLTPILASEEQVTRYGPLAAGKKQTRRAFENSYAALGDVVEGLQNKASNFTQVSPKQQQSFLTKLKSIGNDIETRTAHLSPEELAHVDFIKDTVSNIEKNGINPRQAIGLWRSLNKIKLGQGELGRLREPIMGLLKEVDPVLAKEFQVTNRLYQNYFRNLKEINPTAFNSFINAGEMQKLMGAVFSGSPETLGKSILNYGSFGALKKVASSMITNPNFQSFSRKFRVAVNSGNSSAQKNLYRQFVDQVKKEYPEEYTEINWPEISKK